MSVRSLRTVLLLLALLLTAAGCAPVVPLSAPPSPAAPVAAVTPAPAAPTESVPPAAEAVAPALRLLGPDLAQPLALPFEVRWEPVAQGGVATYRVVITDMGTSELVFQQDMSATRVTVEAGLKPGRGYMLGIHALDAVGKQVAAFMGEFRMAGEAIPPAEEALQALPGACHREGLLTYFDREAGLCFAYPQGFALAGPQGSYAQGSQARTEVRGPAIGAGPEPLFARLSLDFRPYQGVELPQFVDEMIKADVPAELAAQVERRQMVWAGRAAEVLEPWPGRLASRVVVVDAAPRGFHILTFWPSFAGDPGQPAGDALRAQKDMYALYEIVAETFATLPPPGVPLDPASRLDLPWSCLLSGRPLYVEAEGGYCLVVTPEMALRRESSGGVGFYGPALDNSAEPLRVQFSLTVSDAAPDATLDGAAERLLAPFGQLPYTVDRQTITVGGEPAMRLDGIPGRPTSIAVLMLHGGKLYQFRFTPDLTFEKSRTATVPLVDLVLSSFGFLPAVAAPVAPPAPAVLVQSEPYAGITFAYPSDLASGTRGETQPGVNDPNGPWWELAPEHVAIALTNYALPQTLHAPRVIVYPVAELAARSPAAQAQIEALQNLLAARPEKPQAPLPFLPLANAVQQTHALVRYLSFEGGAGVRYVAQYAQAPVPLNNTDLFYTFQGLTADGRYYVVAILPVTHPTLPATANDMPPAQMAALTADFAGYIQEVTATLDSGAGAGFVPPLSDLDALVQTIHVGQ